MPRKRVSRVSRGSKSSAAASKRKPPTKTTKKVKDEDVSGDENPTIVNEEDQPTSDAANREDDESGAENEELSNDQVDDDLPSSPISLDIGANQNNSVNGDNGETYDDERSDEDVVEDIIKPGSPSEDFAQSPPLDKPNKNDQTSKKKSNEKESSKSNSVSKRDSSRDGKKPKSPKEPESNSSDKGRNDSDTEDYDVDYFGRMFDRTKARFQLETDKELFIENLWKNIKGKEFDLATHKYSSFCLSWFIQNVDDIDIIKEISEAIDPEKFTFDFMTDDFSVLVIESMLEVLIRKISHEDNFETDTSKWMLKWVESLGDAVLSNMKSLMQTYTNNSRHILVSIIEAMGGIRIGRYWCRKNMRLGGVKTEPLSILIGRDAAFKELPQSFKDYLRKLTKTMVIVPSNEAVCETLFSRCTNLAQYLLFVLKIRCQDLCQMVVKKMIDALFSAPESTRDAITKSASGAYIVEILLLVASESRLYKIWTKYLKGHLEQYWKHDISNFIVQRLIDASKEEKLFEEVCLELFHDMDDLFQSDRNSIPVCLSKACRDRPKMQSAFTTSVMKAFGCYEQKEKQLSFAPTLLFHNSKNDRNLWLHGSLMLQNMLWFTDPYKVAKSVLAMNVNSLMRICRDCSGSYVVEAFLRSSYVQLRHKSELVEKFLGNYGALSRDRYGSHVVQIVMKLSNEQVQAAISKELYRNPDKPHFNDRFGHKYTPGTFRFKRRGTGEWRDFSDRERVKRKHEGEEFSGPVKRYRDRFNNSGDRDHFEPRRGDHTQRWNRGGGHDRPRFGFGGKRF